MRRRRFVITAAVLGAVLALGGVPAAEAASPKAPLSFDTTDKRQIAEAYDRLLAPSVKTPIGWTGSVSGCKAGTVSKAQVTATKRTVNFARRLAGLTTIGISAALSAKAQQAAVVFSANKQLSHAIPDSWKCVTADAKTAGSRSDIALGAGGVKAVMLYLDDPGSSNVVAGHRRWILNPAAKTFGTGSTNTANALLVTGSVRAKGSYADPTWVSWPTAGYFPKQLEPEGLWSLSSGGSAAVDFSRATVQVVHGGKRLPVTVHPSVNGYAQPTLTWTVTGVKTPKSGLAARYTVTVSGIVRAGKTVSHRYQVRLFDPTKLR